MLKSFDATAGANLKLINLILGILVALFVMIVLLGGIKRLARVTELLVPFMAALYIVMALGVVFGNIKSVPAAFGSIFEGAFNPRAVTGGVIGSMFLSMKKGIARGIFSNEAGLGSNAIIHAAAQTDSPAEQGCWGILEVFLDTVVMCTVTAITLLVSGAPTDGDGSLACAAAFGSVFGKAGSIFVCMSICIFAFATLIGWSYYGRRGLEYLLGAKSAKIYNIIYAAAVFIGCVADLELVWELSDLANALMAVPNLISLCLLSGEATKELKKTYHN